MPETVLVDWEMQQDCLVDGLRGCRRKSASKSRFWVSRERPGHW